MLTIGDMSRVTGLTARTLRYYEEIGLLIPAGRTAAGYRMYDEENLRRLETVMLFRELEFPLDEIARLLACPDFDRKAAIKRQIEVLEEKKRRCERLIAYARSLCMKGEKEMSFSLYDEKKMKEYEAEAEQRWGKTAAWDEYEKKQIPEEDKKDLAGEMMKIFAAFGAVKETDPRDKKAQALVTELRDYITVHFYTCTNAILASLGEMYAADGEMKDNIDLAGGTGTAAFAAKAIKIFCENGRENSEIPRPDIP